MRATPARSACSVQRLRSAVRFVAGGIAGACVDFVLFPLDTIKTYDAHVCPSPACARNSRGPRSRLQARSADVKVQRSSQFYRGLLSAMAGSFPAAATFWFTYEAAKDVLEPLAPTPALLPAAHVLSASVGACARLPACGQCALAHALPHPCAAEVATCIVRNPFEVVKQQMQAGQHASTAAALRKLWRQGGLASFYVGYGTLLAREIPFDALQFALYEWLKRSWAARKGPHAPLTLTDNMVVGCVSGGATAVLTTPLDVVKTRLMTQAAGAPDAYRGMVHGLQRICAEEGAARLFAGAVPRMLWISLGGAIFFGTFEEARRRLSSSEGGAGAGRRD